MGKTPQDFARLQRAEERRVREILRRDREEYGKDIARAAAEIEFDKGKTVTIVDIAIEPTPEWKDKGPYETFTPRLEDGTVKTVKGHRRIFGSVPQALFMRGRIREDHYHACIWYAVQWELSGQDGRVKTNHLSLTGNVGGGGGAGQSPMALHAREAEARQAFRAARAAIPEHLLKMFELVALKNLSINRASRFVRCRNGNAVPKLIEACMALVAHLEATKTEFAPTDPGRD